MESEGGEGKDLGVARLPIPMTASANEQRKRKKKSQRAHGFRAAAAKDEGEKEGKVGVARKGGVSSGHQRPLRLFVYRPPRKKRKMGGDIRRVS